MTRCSILEYAEAVRERYFRGTKKKKAEMLNEFVAKTGLHRKAAIRLLNRRSRSSVRKRSSKAAFKALDDIYTLLRLYVTFFQQVLKMVRKTRHGAKVHKVYDKAQTPYHRLIGSGVLTEDKKHELASIYAALNPVTLLKQIKEEVQRLWTLAEPLPSISKRCSSMPSSVTGFMTQ